MKLYNKPFSFAVVLALLTSCLGHSATLKSPQAVVEEYCYLDAQGANFNSTNSNAKRIVELLTNEDEAGYDSSVIVQTYHLGKPKTNNNGVDIEVVYEDLGSIGAGQLKRQDRRETVLFHLTSVGNVWKIDGLRMPPHISKQWLLSHIRSGLRPDQISTNGLIAVLSQWGKR
jgi:hypothetical protein